MLGHVAVRLAQALVVMLVMSVLVFVGVYAIGNPIDVLIGPDVSQELRLQTIAQYGLDRPLWEQYLTFLGRVLHGDFGRSFVFGMPVMDLILSRLPATLELTLAAVCGAALIGIPAGIYAGYRPDGIASKLIMTVSILGFSVPTFWIGLVLIMAFAVELQWLPAGGRGETVSIFGVEWSFLTLNGLSHLLLPALNLAFFKLALMTRLARAGTIGQTPPEAARDEARLIARLAPSPAAALAWADLSHNLAVRARRGKAVNLDPAALLMDTLLKIDETAGRLAS